MTIQFQTMDGAFFLLDTEALTWMRVAEPPHVNEDSLVVSNVLEEGKLNPTGYGVFALDGRVPDSPGAGLTSVGVTPIPHETTLDIYLRGNVEIQNFTMPRPIDTIKYHCLPPFPLVAKPSVQSSFQSSGQNSVHIADTEEK